MAQTANLPMQFANSVISIDSDPAAAVLMIAKVTSINRQIQLTEVDVTGVEDVSGNLVFEQFEMVSKGETVELEGITVSGAGETVATRLEPGQSFLHDAADTGAAVILTVVDLNGKGFDFHGKFLSYSEAAQVKDVWKFTGSMRVNTRVAVTP